MPSVVTLGHVEFGKDIEDLILAFNNIKIIFLSAGESVADTLGQK